MFHRVGFIARGLAGAFAVMTFGTAHSSGLTLTGGGSSFAAPLYRAWGAELHRQTGLSLTYRSVGSGEGQKLVMAGAVDFGASDLPLAASVLRTRELYQAPTAIGAIVVVINVPGVASGQMKLDGPTLAALFDGAITSWADPRVRALNPGLRLPDLDVLPIHREEASGTSQVFSSYLHAVAPDWKAGMWGDGSEARGNDGVAASVRQSVGGIGFVEYAFARRDRLNTVRLKNHAGQFVAPGKAAFTSAAFSMDWTHADHYAVRFLEAPASQAWPIMSATFVLLPIHPADRAKAAAVKTLFRYALKQGDDIARDLDYVPLPPSVKDTVLSGWP
ncbi:phosphate ABC transporter substrate-binding protein PstS [Gluconobacter aidae]|uniref:Phosphate-binding protein PstS n=1 Tax=Gluconobacter aidae TaxID=2662454 RepID=A0A7X1VPC6_9PROT|nr:phosphate ABC transporter substrate-binding protein PstS [Gluconobacter aidae]MQR99626.1 phosphate ABC transporter substrate-binding protein PstS [Gluconobacter aidae]